MPVAGGTTGDVADRHDLLATGAGEQRAPLDGCPCEDQPCRHVQTYMDRRSATPWQDDYLFASPRFAERLDACHVEQTPWDLSDHRPVIAKFDLG